MKVGIIAVTDVNGVMAIDGRLPCNCRPDMERFRRLTIGYGNNALIMGRVTHESIGRTLPNRRNIVISRSILDEQGRSYYGHVSVTGVLAGDLQLAIEDASHCRIDRAFVIGGHNLYLEALSIADTLHLTVLNKDAADPNAKSHVYFPGFASLLMDMSKLGPGALHVEQHKDYAFLTVDLVARRALHKEAA
jgi:dihydrofolate reductase